MKTLLNSQGNINQYEHSAFLMRISLGFILLAHGLLKVMVFTIPGTVGFFESLGLPAFIAYFTMILEILGGIALIAGVFTRLIALASLPILLGATWTHFSNGWVFSAEGGGWEFPALLTVLAVAVALQGSGKYALGQLILGNQQQKAHP